MLQKVNLQDSYPARNKPKVFYGCFARTQPEPKLNLKNPIRFTTMY